MVISNCRERRQRQGKLKVIEREKLHRKKERDLEKRKDHKQHNLCPCPGERKKYKPKHIIDTQKTSTFQTLQEKEEEEEEEEEEESLENPNSKTCSFLHSLKDQ